MSGEDLGNSGNVAGDWKDERISMTHLASFSRSSTYVRSLVRQQFQQQCEPTTAWERLRERLAKSGDVFNYDEETPNFVKKKEAKRDKEEQMSEGEENSAREEDDDDEEEETSVNLKASGRERKSSTSKRSKEEDSNSPSVYCADSSARDRHRSVPQNSGRGSDKQFTLGSTDVHSKILNRRLSLAENVIKNYSKYIRTPDETHKQQENSLCIKVEGDEAYTLGESAKVRRGSKQPSVVAISEELDDSTQESTAVAVLPTPMPLSPQTLLTIPDGYTAGSSYSVPPTPVAIRENSFQEPPTNVRRNSLSNLNPDPNSDGLLVIRSRTDLTSETASKGADVQPRVIRTSRGKREIVYPESRREAIKQLRQDYRTLAKSKRLNDVVVHKGATFYEMLQKDRERRDRESAIFRQEMEEIMTSLKGINFRLDQRIRVLDCSEPSLPKINPKLHRLVQQAVLGIAPQNNLTLMES